MQRHKSDLGSVLLIDRLNRLKFDNAYLFLFHSFWGCDLTSFSKSCVVQRKCFETYNIIELQRNTFTYNTSACKVAYKI